MHLIARLCVGYCFWKFVRWFDSVPWKNLFSAQRHTVKIHKPLPVTYDTLPNLAGISANDYFRSRRAKQNPDLSDSAFMAWRAKNNR